MPLDFNNAPRQDESPDHSAQIHALVNAAINPVKKPPANGDAGGDEQQPAKYEPRPVCDLVDVMEGEYPPLEWIIPDIVPREGLMVLSGGPKSGKSFLLLDWLYNIATGGKTLEFYQLEKGAVKYIGNEDNNRRLKDRMQRLFPNWRNEIERGYFEVESLDSHEDTFPRLNEGAVSEVRFWHARTKESGLNPSAFVFDVYANVKPRGNDNSADPYEAFYEEISELKRLALELRIAIFIVLHNRKATSSKNGNPFDEIAGTMAKAAAVDGIFTLEREFSGESDRGASNGKMHGTGKDLGEFTKHLIYEDCRWRIDEKKMSVKEYENKIKADEDQDFKKAIFAVTRPIRPDRISKTALGIAIEKLGSHGTKKTVIGKLKTLWGNATEIDICGLPMTWSEEFVNGSWREYYQFSDDIKDG